MLNLWDVAVGSQTGLIVQDKWDASDDEGKPKTTNERNQAKFGAKKSATDTNKFNPTGRGAGKAAEDYDWDETVEERKRRLRKLETDADFENVQDLFANVKCKFTGSFGCSVRNGADVLIFSFGARRSGRGTN